MRFTFHFVHLEHRPWLVTGGDSGNLPAEVQGVADPAQSPVLFPGQYLDVPLRHGERWIAFVAEGEPCEAYVSGRV